MKALCTKNLRVAAEVSLRREAWDDTGRPSAAGVPVREDLARGGVPRGTRAVDGVVVATIAAAERAWSPPRGTCPAIASFESPLEGEGIEGGVGRPLTTGAVVLGLGPAVILGTAGGEGERWERGRWPLR